MVFSWSINSNHVSKQFQLCFKINTTDRKKFTRLQKLFFNICLCKNNSNYISTLLALNTHKAMEQHATYSERKSSVVWTDWWKNGDNANIFYYIFKSLIGLISFILPFPHLHPTNPFSYPSRSKWPEVINKSSAPAGNSTGLTSSASLP